MKTTLIILKIFVSSNSFGQQIKTDSTKTVEVKNEIKVEDLVLKCGGFITFFYSKQDKAFEKKYKIRYEIFGCLRPEKEEVLIANNTKVVKYLDDK